MSLKAGNWVIWYDRTPSGQPVSRIGQVLAILQPGTVINRAGLEALHVDPDKFLHDFRGPGFDAPQGEDPVVLVAVPNPSGGLPYLQVPVFRKLLFLSNAHAG